MILSYDNRYFTIGKIIMGNDVRKNVWKCSKLWRMNTRFDSNYFWYGLLPHYKLFNWLYEEFYD
jgi:hypothetical protein